MLQTISKPLVRLTERYLPDPYVFVLLLSVVVMLAAMVFEGQGPIAVITMWGDGFWSLLQFSMQMVLVLVTGYMMASTPFVKGILNRIAGAASSAGTAIILVSVVSLVASWINWGFGLVVGALLAKAVARRIAVDYRLLVASAYSGFVVWHGGLAGSIPLAIATPGHPFEGDIGVIGASETIFAFYNLAIVAALFVTVPLVNWLMLPKQDEQVIVDPAKLEEPDLDAGTTGRPADAIENSPILSWIVGGAGIVWLVIYAFSGAGLTLNVVNFLFLFLAIVLHGTPRRLLNALTEGVKSSAGIVIQFPFYAGIMAVMVDSGLAASISDGLASIATEATLPFWTFLSAGIVNFFVPSGGGQWAVQAPIMLPAAQALGADVSRVAMAVAWGDAWTNLIQPFWALPILGIAGLNAKDIMGFCVVHLFVSGVLIALGLTFL